MLYKWEENNRGLDHKCGTCKTVLSNPRAKKSCFGVHEEVCMRYHKTLFYVGNAHKCDACRKSVEIHDKRHREIAGLLQTVLHLGEAATGYADSSSISSRERKTRNIDALESLAIKIEVYEDDEWADTSTVCEDELDAATLSLIGKIQTLGTSKDQKKERKAGKNQGRFCVITDDDVGKISEVLHPQKGSLFDITTGYDLLNNSLVDANVSFDPHTFEYSSLRQTKKLAKAKGLSEAPIADTVPDSSQITSILNRLGVDANFIAKHKKDRKGVFHRLRNAIEKDLICVENEERETMMRMAGYWRFANKRTYNHMVRKNELWDWATGAKLPEIDEEGEAGDDERNDTFSQQGTDVESPEKDERVFLLEPENLLESKKTAANLEQSPSRRNNDTASSSADTCPLNPNIPRSKSPWQGIPDTRHLASPPSTSTSTSTSTTPTRASSPNNDEDNDSFTPAALAAVHYHRDPNNRFSPLATKASRSPRAGIFCLSPLACAGNERGRLRPIKVPGSKRCLLGVEEGRGRIGGDKDDGWRVWGKGKRKG